MSYYLFIRFIFVPLLYLKLKKCFFLLFFVPRLVYKVYKMEHFSTKWNTLGKITTDITNIMSSNIQVQRICQHCGSEFTARTTTTLYCSHRCNSAAYKLKVKAAKVQRSNIETKQIKAKPIEELKAKEFLTVTDVSKLINCSRQNVYKLINTGKLKATNVLEKKTIIKRSDLDKIFNEIPETEAIPEQQKRDLYEWKQAGAYDIADCYTLNEVQNKYGISETALQNIIKREGIPKIKKGWYSYVPKILIDNLLK